MHHDLKPSRSSFGNLCDGADGFSFCSPSDSKQCEDLSKRTPTSYFYWRTVSPPSLPSALFQQPLKFGTLPLIHLLSVVNSIVASCFDISDRINMSSYRDVGIILGGKSLSCQSNALVSRIASDLSYISGCSLALTKVTFLLGKWWCLLTLRAVEILPVTALSMWPWCQLLKICCTDCLPGQRGQIHTFSIHKKTYQMIGISIGIHL